MTERVRAEDLFFAIKRIGLDWTARMEMRFPGENITGIQVYFLVYILRHHPKGTYITELCHEIGISKATLSVLVKKLREKGYLCFRENPGMSGRKRCFQRRSSQRKAANCSDRQSGWNLRSAAGWTEWRSSVCGNWSIRS